jgi:hypothetical protein
MWEKLSHLCVYVAIYPAIVKQNPDLNMAIASPRDALRNFNPQNSECFILC